MCLVCLSCALIAADLSSLIAIFLRTLCSSSMVLVSAVDSSHFQLSGLRSWRSLLFCVSSLLWSVSSRSHTNSLKADSMSVRNCLKPPLCPLWNGVEMTSSNSANLMSQLPPLLQVLRMAIHALIPSWLFWNLLSSFSPVALLHEASIALKSVSLLFWNCSLVMDLSVQRSITSSPCS